VSDREYGKKLGEEMDLEPFLSAYRFVTGLDLEVIGLGERPDFRCRRSDGVELGVEVTRVMTDPESRFWKRVLSGEEYADRVDTAIRLQELIYRKDAKRRSLGWILPQFTILVLQLMDCPLDEASCFLDKEVLSEVVATGFLEIWAADYTAMEAYNSVQLYGIKPPKWAGLHDHSMMGSKPYG